MSDADASQPVLDHDAFLALDSMAALGAAYAARGVELEGDALLTRALADWHTVSLARARERTEPPPELEPVGARADGVDYAIYGVVHGMVGGADPAYKEFVDRRLGTLTDVLFENGLHHFYPRATYLVIPDYAVMGLLGSLRIGLEVGLFFPVLMWELIGDLLRRGGGGTEVYDYSPAYHAVDPETRRGVDPNEPVLPSRLQMDLELTRWRARGWRAALLDPMAIVPRSAFMAGFARGHAESRGKTQVDLIVGDLHAVEIKRFLEEKGRYLPDPSFDAGLAFGRRSLGSYRLAVLVAKTLHLGLAGAGGCAVLLPLMAAAYALIRWLT